MTLIKSVLLMMLWMSAMWSYALPEVIHGKITDKMGLTDISGQPFEPSECELTVFRIYQQLHFALAFTAADQNRANYTFSIPDSLVPGFPENRPEKLSVLTPDKNTRLNYDSGMIQIKNRRPASQKVFDLNFVGAGKLEFVTAWDAEALQIHDTELEFSDSLQQVYTLFRDSKPVARAKCELERPLLP